jgi:hypothetical protein
MDTPASPAGSTAREETTRQAIILVFSIAGVLLMIAAQRAAADPDFYRSLRMRAAKSLERAAARAAAWSWGRAEAARVAYDRESA